MMTQNTTDLASIVAELQQRAKQVRRNVLLQARGKGEGYVGQGLGSADMLTALYFHEMRYDVNQPDWPDRDRFPLSTGHYSIVLWATLTAIGLSRRDARYLWRG
jgi:transketolase